MGRCCPSEADPDGVEGGLWSVMAFLVIMCVFAALSARHPAQATSQHPDPLRLRHRHRLTAPDPHSSHPMPRVDPDRG